MIEMNIDRSVAAQLLYLPLAVVSLLTLPLSHWSLAAVLRQRATSGFRKTSAGAQLSILVVIFLFFHYGFVSSGCNRCAINQHYFHISAPTQDAKMASSPVLPSRGARRDNVIDRGRYVCRPRRSPSTGRASRDAISFDPSTSTG